MEQPREWQDSGVKYASKWVFPGTVQRPKGLDPYSKQARKEIQNTQGKGWQVQNTEHRHPVLIKFMARFLQKYATPYFAKL